MRYPFIFLFILLCINSGKTEAGETRCSDFIRLKSYNPAGTVFVQACRSGSLHYLSFRIKKDTTVTSIRFELSPSDLTALAAGRVSHIAIACNASHYVFLLDKSEGLRLQQLCSRQVRNAAGRR
jgi:hypothetical protein